MTPGPMTPDVNIRDFGADPAAADNRAAIQAALVAGAGGTVRVPDGRWRVGRAGNAYHCLVVPAWTTLVGESRAAVLAMTADAAASVRLLEVDAPGVTVQGLTLDGSAAPRDGDEHRHGVFCRASGLTVRDVEASGFTGDGIYLYGGADNATIDQVLCERNGRNGLTYGGAITGGTVTGSVFRANRAQQLDSEPGNPSHVDGITVTGCTFDGGGASNDYALTICGSAGGASRGWRVEGNTVHGGIYVVWASACTIARNTGTNPTTKPSVTVWRTADAIAIVDNELEALTAFAAVSVAGTGTGQAARDVLIARNRLTAHGTQGIALSGAVSVTLEDNVISNPRGGSVAVSARATNPAAPFERVELVGNTAGGFERGLWVGGIVGQPAVLGELEAVRNKLGGPMQLDDGSGALQRARLQDNVPADVSRWPAGAVVATETTVTMTRGSP